MTSIPSRKKRLAPRSRSGCLPCRQHHRKCDERRPICDLCRKNDRTCDYGLSIKWGGRPFYKSTFGQCLSNTNSQSTPIRRIQTGHEDADSNTFRHTPSFIYGIAESPTKVSAATSFQDASVIPPDQPSEVAERQGLQTVSILMSNHREKASLTRTTPKSLPDLPPSYRSLLDYFTHAVDSFSCDAVVKRDFCSVFFPMAYHTSSVMASILNLAAVHRMNAGLTQDPRQLALLQVVVVEQLRLRLEAASASPPESVMATILMMCYSEIVAGGKKAHSWRLHLEGAAALFNKNLSEWTADNPNPTRAFIAKCFVSLIALANMSGCPPSNSVSKQALYMVGNISENNHIDEFTAYSAELLHTFVGIGALLREREGLSGSTNLDERCSGLVQRLRSASRRRHAKLGVRVIAMLSPVRKTEFININEAYHQAALLHIYQRIRRFPSSSTEIQEIVQRILSLISGVEFLNGPCPGIVLLFPLFSAGCGAVQLADRQHVRALLQQMVRLYQIVAVQHSMKVLEALWSNRDEHGECEANTSWEAFIDKDTDLILY